MSFGGIGSILSSLGGLAVTPALTTYADEGIREALGDSDWLKSLIGDDNARELFGDVAGGTLGVALGTGLNAGLGALTGGSSGAKAGALQGLISSGGAAMQHDQFKEALGMGADKAGAMAPKSFAEQVAGKPVSSSGSLADLTGSKAPAGGEFLSSKIGEDTLPAKPTTGAKDTSGVKKPGYFELAGQLGLPAFTLGAGLGSSLDLAAQREEAEKIRKYKEAKQAQDLQNLLSSMYGRPYATGGELKVQTDQGVPTSVTFPDWFIDEFAHSGGLDAMGKYAQGGYINTEPMNPAMTYPQAMIPKAQPYPAASPLRHEVLDYERGGLLEGDGDGMSDHIPANISGKEPVRVADGEYVVPADIAEKLGADKLQAMMTKVRSAAHAKKGKQIVEDAGKRAFIRAMSGVKA